MNRNEKKKLSSLVSDLNDAVEAGLLYDVAEFAEEILKAVKESEEKEKNGEYLESFK